MSISDAQPRNSIGRVAISENESNGVMRRKMDGTSRDAQELPETEVVPHSHTTLSFQASTYWYF